MSKKAKSKFNFLTFHPFINTFISLEQMASYTAAYVIISWAQFKADPNRIKHLRNILKIQRKWHIGVTHFIYLFLDILLTFVVCILFRRIFIFVGSIRRLSNRKRS